MADMINLTTVGDATCSTSSTTSISQGNSCSYVFDVFINHRGPDVKEGLAKHIYHRLKEHGLRVFLDQPELEKGDSVTSQIEEAIRTATVHVAIFSPRYGESSWCLNELVLMLESGSTIIPVFYHVNPWELRWTQSQDGVYARALSILRCILLCKEDENGAYARALCMLEKKTTIDPQTNTKRPRHNSKTIEKWRNALSTLADTSGIDLKACNG